MHKLLSCCLLFLFSIVNLSTLGANDLGLEEVYLQIRIKNNICGYFNNYFDGAGGQISECKILHQPTGKVRLRLNNMSKKYISDKLDMLKQNDVIVWYEFKNQSFEINSLGLDVKSAIDNSRFLTIKGNENISHPWFINDSIKRVQQSLSIYEISSPIVVAIIDSGVNFQSNLPTYLKWTNLREVDGDGDDNDGNGYIDDVHGWDFVETNSSSYLDDTQTPDNDPSDNLGHGTAVAAIVYQTVGTEFSKNLKIMPLRVASGLGGGGDVSPSALAEAIYYAADNGANIINISLAGPQYYKLIDDAVSYAINKKIHIVAAAGNNFGNDVYFPAALHGVIAVGATDKNHTIWNGSANGWGVDIYAPGVDMLSNLGVNSFFLSPNGTSFAAPVITGSLVMLHALRGGGKCISDVNHVIEVAGNKNIDEWLAYQFTKIESDLSKYVDKDGIWVNGGNVCGLNTANVNYLLRTQ